MNVSEYILQPSFRQEITVIRGAQFLTLKAFPNQYGSVEVTMFMLEDPSNKEYETVVVHSYKSYMTFAVDNPLEYLGSIVVARHENYGETVHFFKEV